MTHQCNIVVSNDCLVHTIPSQIVKFMKIDEDSAKVKQWRFSSEKRLKLRSRFCEVVLLVQVTHSALGGLVIYKLFCKFHALCVLPKIMKISWLYVKVMSDEKVGLFETQCSFGYYWLCDRYYCLTLKCNGYFYFCIWLPCVCDNKYRFWLSFCFMHCHWLLLAQRLYFPHNIFTAEIITYEYYLHCGSIVWVQGLNWAGSGRVSDTVPLT